MRYSANTLFNRWKTSAVVLALVLASGLLASCGSDADNEGGNAPQELTVAVLNDLLSADNITSGGTTTDKTILGSTVYDPLFTTDEEGGLQPALATEATPSEDLTTWTVKLREGVTFTNGKEFTAADVKANFEAFLNPDNASTFTSNLSDLKSIDVIDDHTVRFNLTGPDLVFPSQMQDTMYMSDLDARESGELLGADEVPIGTGPYKWVSRETGTSITFAPNEDYWRGNPPLDKVVFRAITDPQQAALALQTGEVDIVANNVADQLLPSLRKDPNIVIQEAPGAYFFRADLNFEKDRRGGYVDGAKVREGLSYLADTETVIPPLVGEGATLATQPVPPWQEGNNPDLQPFPYDEQKGVQLLEEGGISKGDELYLLSMSDRPYLCEWATAFQSKLKELGYKPKLSCQESEVIPAELTKYTWDMLFWSSSGRPTAVTLYEDRYGVAQTLPEPSDTYTLRDETLQAMIDKMKATQSDEEYAQLGAEIANRIEKIDIAHIPGYFQNVFLLSRSNVEGLKLSPLAYYGLLYNAMGVVSIDNG